MFAFISKSGLVSSFDLLFKQYCKPSIDHHYSYTTLSSKYNSCNFIFSRIKLIFNIKLSQIVRYSITWILIWNYNEENLGVNFKVFNCGQRVKIRWWARQKFRNCLFKRKSQKYHLLIEKSKSRIQSKDNVDWRKNIS